MMIRKSNNDRDRDRAGVQVAVPYARGKQMRGPLAVRSSPGFSRAGFGRMGLSADRLR
jgi:hypothetical protein